MQRLVMMTSGDGGVDSYRGPSPYENPLQLIYTIACSTAINSHCQIIKAEAVRTTGFSPDISSTYLPQDPPSGGRPADLFRISSLRALPAIPLLPEFCPIRGAGFTYLQPKQFASKASLRDSLNVNADSA